MNLHVCNAYRVVKHGNVVFPLNIDESIAVPHGNAFERGCPTNPTIPSALAQWPPF